jgi:uncharacterized membrane protein
MTTWHKRALISCVIWAVVAAGFTICVLLSDGPGVFTEGTPERNIAAGFVAAGIFSHLVLRYITRQRAGSTGIQIDERDVLISQRSSEGAFAVLAIFVFLSCIVLHDRFQGAGSVPVGWLWILAYASWILGYLSLAVTALVLYTRSGGGHAEG